MKRKICPRCNKSLRLNLFYKRRDATGHTCYCKSCLKLQYLERHYAFKLKCVTYKGGKCEVCSYDKCLAALDFHHINPAKKKFSLAQRKHRSNWDIIQSELDKCRLLCCRCHREAEHQDAPCGNRTHLRVFRER